MGDCNVASRRSGDSPSSSPKLGARIKDLEVSRVKDILPVEEGDFLLMARQSAKPEESIYKISDDKHVADETDLPEHEKREVTEPLVFVSPSGEESTITSYPYFETKLRPDAPPFTPESLSKSVLGAREIVEISDRVCLEPSIVPRVIENDDDDDDDDENDDDGDDADDMNDDSCFVNIDLRCTDHRHAEKNLPEPEFRVKDFHESTIDPQLKELNVTSTPKLKRSMPKAELSVDSFQANIDEIDESVVMTESGPNEPETREPRPETGEPRFVRGYWRILRTTFILSNKIQIVVFIASLVICMILVIYVVV